MRQIIAILFIMFGIKIAELIDKKGTQKFLLEFVKSADIEIKKKKDTPL